MKLSDIISKIQVKDEITSFYQFTNKWIQYVLSQKKSEEINEDDWKKLFGQDNPVAGVRWGEMKDVKGGKELNEQKSFKDGWDRELRNRIQDAINTKDISEKILKIKELNQLILHIIKKGGGRERPTAVNRMLTTFFPELFIKNPQPEMLKEFINLLHQFVENSDSIIDADNWIDNSYNVRKFFKDELTDNNERLSAWWVYKYLKDNKDNLEAKDNKSMIDDVRTNKTSTIKSTKYDEFVKLLNGNYNLILTGAPGTGKTYLAKQIAKAMGATDDSCKIVQFHPSYDYTDFVEGLRPVKKGQELGFERKDGVFKDFCKDALKNTWNIDKAYSELINDIKVGTIKTLSTKIKETAELKIRGGDNICWYSEGEKGNISSNCVSRDRLIKLYSFYNTTEKLESMNNVQDGIKSVIGGCDTTYYWAVLNHILRKKSEAQPYVFIIDEINRGEISKIFGELFYSIDPGYRGEKGKVDTQYQNLIPKDDNNPDYDPNNPDVFRDGFYVPENVYIIGTMNDIDRSVESMDFAMRRRFAWKEVSAKSRQSMLDEVDAWKPYAKPSQDIIDKMKARMDNLNAAIIDQYQYGDEPLSNKDKVGLSKAYQIGTAYFLKYVLYNDFEELWTNHLEGLLYEYLRGKSNIDEKIKRLHIAYNDTATH